MQEGNIGTKRCEMEITKRKVTLQSSDASRCATRIFQKEDKSTRVHVARGVSLLAGNCQRRQNWRRPSGAAVGRGHARRGDRGALLLPGSSRHYITLSTARHVESGTARDAPASAAREVEGIQVPRSPCQARTVALQGKRGRNREVVWTMGDGSTKG